MIRKLTASSFVLATLIGLSLGSTGIAEARDGRGGAFAAGAAVGVVGGAILGSALTNPGYGAPVYVDPEPVYVAPRPRCWYEEREVRNRYDWGTHIESVRICR
jgi:PXPV repeat-containing protein